MHAVAQERVVHHSSQREVDACVIARSKQQGGGAGGGVGVTGLVLVPVERTYECHLRNVNDRQRAARTFKARVTTRAIDARTCKASSRVTMCARTCKARAPLATKLTECAHTMPAARLPFRHRHMHVRRVVPLQHVNTHVAPRPCRKWHAQCPSTCACTWRCPMATVRIRGHGSRNEEARVLHT